MIMSFRKKEGLYCIRQLLGPTDIKIAGKCIDFNKNIENFSFSLGMNNELNSRRNILSRPKFKQGIKSLIFRYKNISPAKPFHVQCFLCLCYQCATTRTCPLT